MWCVCACVCASDRRHDVDFCVVYLGFSQEVTLLELLNLLLPWPEHFSLWDQEGRQDLPPLGRDNSSHTLFHTHTLSAQSKLNQPQYKY